MNNETRQAFKKIHDRFDSLESKMDEGFEEVKNMMDHGFSQLLPEEQWPPNEHDLQRAEIRRKL